MSTASGSVLCRGPMRCALSVVFGILLAGHASARAQEALPEEEEAVEATAPDAALTPPPPPTVAPAIEAPPTAYVAAGAPTVAAPEPAIDESHRRQVALLDRWIERLRNEERFGRIFGGVALTVIGPVLSFMGGWLVLDPQFHSVDSSLVTGVGVVAVGVGLMGLATGILALTQGFLAERRFDRFTESSLDGIDARELGSYEGELRALAEAETLARPVGIVAGIGMAVGGAVAFGLTAAGEHLTDDAQLIGYGIAGGLVLVGAVTVAASLFETPYERAWRMYENGETPEGDRGIAQVRVAPFASAHEAGVAVAGAF